MPRPKEIRRLRRRELPTDTIRLARYLIGKTLVRDLPQGRISGRIVETEAYLPDDAACHAFRGPTPRNRALFLERGHAYVYFIYGNHYCLNVSCEPEGKPGGVLFRAVEPLTGIEEMARARGLVLSGPRSLPKLTSGPGRMAEAFGITRDRDNGCDLTSATSSLWIGDDGYQTGGIRLTPRIGITKAADRPLRYILAGNSFVSGPKTFPGR